MLQTPISTQKQLEKDHNWKTNHVISRPSFSKKDKNKD